MTRYKKIRELAEAADVHEMTIRRAVASGELQAVRVGRTIRVSEEAFEEYLRRPPPAKQRAK